MFSPLFGNDEKAPRRRREYENYVGSRFLLRMSNDLKSVPRRFTTRFTSARPQRVQQTTALSSKNPTYENKDGVAAPPRPVIPSAIMHVAIPGYEAPRASVEHNNTKPKVGLGLKQKALCLLLLFLGVFALIIGLVVASSAQSAAAANVDNGTAAPTLSPSDPVLGTHSPTTSPTLSTPSPTLATFAPSLSPTDRGKGKTSSPTRRNDDDD